MRSVTCPSCGFVSWATADDCKQCGKPFALNQTYHRPSSPPSHSYGPAQDYFAHDYFGDTQKKRAGHAIASLVIGIVGFFTFGIFLIGSVVGTVLGMVALNRQKREPAQYGGRGVAIAGLVMNIGGLVMVVPIGIIAAIAIPNLLAARRAANEASALRTMSVIMAAEQTYSAQYGDGEFGELADLIKYKLVEPELRSGVKNSYDFTVVNYGSDFEVTATPVRAEVGRRSFFFSSSDGVIRARVGMTPATEDDPPLDSYNDPRPRYNAPSEAHVPAYAPTN